MFMGMIIAIFRLYCVQGRVAIPVNGSCYCNKARESNNNC